MLPTSIQITSHTSQIREESQQKIKRRKRHKSKSTKVRFSKRVLVNEIPHLNDISKQQIETTWYTQKEYSDITSELKLTLRLEKSGVIGLDICERLCFRGLEARTQEGSILRKTNRLKALETVLYEQSRQRLDGMYSSDDMSKVYTDTVFRSRRAAYAKGSSDAREVFEEYTTKEEELQESKMDKSSVQRSKSKGIVPRSKLSRFLKSLSQVSQSDFQKR
jgi:hypothetical protein